MFKQWAILSTSEPLLILEGPVVDKVRRVHEIHEDTRF